jgi:hypothetical protein
MVARRGSITCDATERGRGAVPCVSSSLGREVVIDPQGNDAAIDLRLLVDRDQ